MISSTGSGFATDDNEVTASGCSIPTRHRSHHATGWERRRHLGRAAAPTGRHAAADRGAVCAPAGPPDHGAARLRRASVRRGHQGACHHPEDPTDTPVNAIAAVMLSSRGGRVDRHPAVGRPARGSSEVEGTHPEPTRREEVSGGPLALGVLLLARQQSPRHPAGDVAA